VKADCLLPVLFVSLALSASSAACAGGEKGAEQVPTVGPLPGAPAWSRALGERLAGALAAKGGGYEPRTRHLTEAGPPRFTNRLILESSPYLAQHAHNPVNWYPWGEEAFADAKRLGRPVLLSIGYSTCHWCHVMEHESFEDEAIAAYLNANYVAIKVDREERPDLDAIYMAAVQMLTGRGGWPMTTWLTPEKEPFFGGTYFPARDGDRGSRKGFLTLLRELKEMYDERPDEVAGQAGQITARIRRAMAPRAGGEIPDLEVLDRVVARYRESFDSVDGGRRQRPKFPSSFPVRLLLGQYRRTGDEALRDMAALTLSRMAAGGIHDQVGGGFHRYATDSKWLVPHFEKMLYDNALLAVAYLEGYQATGREEFAEVARGILRYVEREMTAPGGAFYSATDADSAGPDGEMEEGLFFTWTPAEIEAVLGPDGAVRFQAYYGVTARGNFEGRSILNVPRPRDEVARLLGLGEAELAAGLERDRVRLREARARRPAPLRDEKILTSWNGLMISAMVQCGFALAEPDFVRAATRAADFLLSEARRDGRLLRSSRGEAGRQRAFLDDYAFLTAGVLDLYEATGEARWLGEAIALQGVLDAHYADREGGGYFMTADDHETLLAREKPARDGAEPSGNSVALMNLLRLGELTLEDRYRLGAEKLLHGVGAALAASPTGFADLLRALDFRLGSPREIVIVTPGPVSDAEPFLELLRREFEPHKVVMVVSEEATDRAEHAKLVPLIRGKTARKGRTTAYVCEAGVCQLPTGDVDVFRRQLARGSVAAD